MKKIINKILLSVLVLCELFNTTTVYALTKDETVYAKLKENGEIDSISISEHLYNYKGQNISDKSILTNIKNINGIETFKQNGNSVTWNSNGNDIHYQGSYDKKLPVELTVKYYLNNEEKDINDIIGKKGRVKILITYKNSLSRNMTINGKLEKIYVPYAIVTTTILNNNDSKNIKVTNGKVIDNGVSSVVMAISSPGLYDSLKLDDFKNINKVEISFDTDKFELNPIYSVATTSLFDDDNLNLFGEINNLYKSINLLQSNMNSIVDASKKLDNGSKQLNSGLTELNNKIQELTNKYKDLKNKDQNILKEEIIGIIEKNINKITPALEEEITNETSKLIKENKEELENAVITYTKQNTKIVVDEEVSKIVNKLDFNSIMGKVINSNVFNLLKNDDEIKLLTYSLKSSIEEELKGIIAKEFANIKNSISNSMSESEKQAYIISIATKYNVTPEQAAGIVNEVQNDTLNQIKKTISTTDITSKIISALNNKEFLSNLVNDYINKLNNKLSDILNKDTTVDELTRDIKTKLIGAIKKDLETNNSYLNTDVKSYIENLMNTIIDNTSSDLAKKYTEDYTNRVVKNVVSKEFNPENVDKKLRELLDIYDEDIKNKVTVIDDTINTLSNAILELNNGSKNLSDGMSALSDGLDKYNKEGINKINKLVNGDVKTLQKRLDAIIKLSNANRMIDNVPNGADSNSKIIFMIDSVSEVEENKK